MDRIMDIPTAAGVLGKSPIVLRRQCAAGEIRHCEKEGSKWYINASREWPRLFPADPMPARPSPDNETLEQIAAAHAKLAELYGKLARA